MLILIISQIYKKVDRNFEEKNHYFKTNKTLKKLFIIKNSNSKSHLKNHATNKNLLKVNFIYFDLELYFHFEVI